MNWWPRHNNLLAHCCIQKAHKREMHEHLTCHLTYNLWQTIALLKKIILFLALQLLLLDGDTFDETEGIHYRIFYNLQYRISAMAARSVSNDRSKRLTFIVHSEASEKKIGARSSWRPPSKNSCHNSINFAFRHFSSSSNLYVSCFIVALLSTLCTTFTSAQQLQQDEGTAYLYEDDLYDSYYYEDDYNIGNTRYYKQGDSKLNGQQHSGNIQ